MTLKTKCDRSWFTTKFLNEIEMITGMRQNVLQMNLPQPHVLSKNAGKNDPTKSVDLRSEITNIISHISPSLKDKSEMPRWMIMDDYVRF